MIHVKDYICNPQHFIVNHSKNRYYNAHGVWFMNEARKFEKYGYDICKNVSDEEINNSTYSEATKKNLESKKHNTRIFAIYGNNGKVWFCKTNPDNIEHLFLVTHSYLYWFNSRLSGINEIKVFSTESQKYVERRSCYNKLIGWMKSEKDFCKEAIENNFKHLKTYETLKELKVKLN